jgi:hypothetical protein
MDCSLKEGDVDVARADADADADEDGDGDGGGGEGFRSGLMMIVGYCRILVDFKVGRFPTHRLRRKAEAFALWGDLCRPLSLRAGGLAAARPKKNRGSPILGQERGHGACESIIASYFNSLCYAWSIPWKHVPDAISSSLHMPFQSADCSIY